MPDAKLQRCWNEKADEMIRFFNIGVLLTVADLA